MCHYCGRKAAMVPHIAITIPKPRTPASKMEQWPASMIFAEIGPITHNINAENAPRNAITELNSGIRMEKTTERTVTRTL